MDFSAAIIGGGAVGLAIAAELSDKVESLALFERHAETGRETSSRNSEVVHAGIYYQPGSLKAELCVSGRRIIERLATEGLVNYRKCGKLIIARNADEITQLEILKDIGEKNGVENLTLLGREETLRMEPRIAAVAALYSPETAIFSAHSLMDFFCKKAEDDGALAVCGAEVTGLEKISGGWRVYYHDAEGENSCTAQAVINAAGLGSQAIMRLAGMVPEQCGLQLHLCKGEYFSVQGAKRKLVNMLVYPPPEKNLKSLGIHTVVDLGGGLKLGPSAFYVDEIDYAVDGSHRKEFYDDVKNYLPFIVENDLSPDMSGIRPKLSGSGEAARDFYICHESARGLDGFFNLAGIDSPGLTASSAIGKYVAALVVDFLQ
jgi:L-2-hydroxyglutarate oxidase LhgO